MSPADRQPGRLKVMTILGTRPEIIRLSAIIPRLDEHTHHVLVHTGQNHDYELNELFFEELGLRRPDRFLSVDTGSLGRALGETLIRTEEALLAERPEAVLILGDTNSAIAAVMARRMKVPVYHMEAGNRCFDLNVPEEINRRLVDHVSDVNLVYTEHARRHLLAEGIAPRFVYLTGSPMREVLDRHRGGIADSSILDELGLERRGYLLASVHREENVDHRESLQRVVEILSRLHAEQGVPVVVSTHPRTRRRLDAAGLGQQTEGIRFLKPFGFFDYIRLQLDARCTISDSGTLTEESAILGFPAVSLRNATERPEGLDTGCVSLTGLDPDTVLHAVALAVAGSERIGEREIPPEYRVANTSERVVRLMLGTARLVHRWQGLDRFSRYDWDEQG